MVIAGKPEPSFSSMPLLPLKTPQHRACPGRPEHSPVPRADAGGATAGDPGVAPALPQRGTDFPGGLRGPHGRIILCSLGPDNHGCEGRAAGFWGGKPRLGESH